MLEETETEETIGFFVTFLSLVTFQLGSGAGPPGYAYVLGSFVLKMRKILATSEAEFNSSAGVSVSLKPLETKASCRSYAAAPINDVTNRSNGIAATKT